MSTLALTSRLDSSVGKGLLENSKDNQSTDDTCEKILRQLLSRFNTEKEDRIELYSRISTACKDYAKSTGRDSESIEITNINKINRHLPEKAQLPIITPVFACLIAQKSQPDGSSWKDWLDLTEREKMTLLCDSAKILYTTLKQLSTLRSDNTTQDSEPNVVAEESKGMSMEKSEMWKGRSSGMESAGVQSAVETEKKVWMTNIFKWNETLPAGSQLPEGMTLGQVVRCGKELQL